MERLVARLRGWASGSAVVATFADYLGLALLTPALPFYLDELGFNDDEVAVWNGVITASQFAFIIVGNLFWGFVSDRKGSKAALQLAMVGDCVFFGLTAAAPFGLGGNVVSSGIVLSIVRAGAGFCTPLVSALIFIFDRASSPGEVVRGMGAYGNAIMLAYALGGVLIGIAYDEVGWAPINAGSAVVTGVAALYVTVLSAPPLHSGPRPKPRGLMRALRTAAFITHGATAFICGYIMNVAIFMLIIVLKEVFLW